MNNNTTSLKNKWLILIILLFTLCLMASLGAYMTYPREIVLEFGMFTGSNWDVANANSFVIIDKAIKRFESEHPNVKIHYYSGVRRDDYSEWYSRKLLEGKQPDVFMVLGTDFNQFTALGVMKNLEDLMDSDTAFDKKKYFSTSLAAGQYSNCQYALPYETVPTLMFVNKDLLRQEGIQMPDQSWTWKDLSEICRKITKDTDHDGILDEFGICNYGWIDAVCSNGSELFRNDGRECYLNNPKVVESIKFIRHLNEMNQGQKIGQEEFNQGSVAFMPLTFAEYRTYKTYPYKIKRYTNFQWDCITMPAGDQGTNCSSVDTLLMGIGAHTDHEKLAWEFLKLLTYDEEIQMDIFRYSQGASVLKAVTESQEAEVIVQQDMEEGDKVISGNLLGQVIEQGHIEPQFKKYEQAMSMVDNEIKMILEEDKTIESSLKILQRNVNEYLRQ